MDITTRPIGVSEHHFLKEMLAEAIFDPEPHWPRSIINLPELTKYIKDWGQPGDIALVAVEQAELIGAIWCRQLNQTDPGYGYISDTIPELGMAVKPHYRNKGIGTQLLTGLMKNATDNGVEAISLSVDKRNQAIHLYERVGFRIVREGQTAFTMKRDI